jgi:hypothetical protein
LIDLLALAVCPMLMGKTNRMSFKNLHDLSPAKKQRLLLLTATSVMAEAAFSAGGVSGLAATDESAPQYPGLTDLERFFRLLDAAAHLICHAKI